MFSLAKGIKFGVSVCIAAAACAGPALAAEVKVGLLGQYSGTYSWWGQEYDRGVEMFMSETGGKVGDHTITIVRRDEGGSSPQRARQLAQELVIRDKVQYLVGGTFTPTVLGTADIVDQTETPYLFTNGITSSMTERTPYFIRLGYTSWARSVPLVQWIYEQGVKDVVTIVADYAPGADVEAAFITTFEQLGGNVAANIRVPMGTTDFSTYLQRIGDADVKHVLMFMPVGPMSAGLIRAFDERGLGDQGFVLYGGPETQEADLPVLGDAAKGMVTALHYSPYLDTAVNRDFIQRYQEKFGPNEVPSIGAISIYDAMKGVARMIEVTDGKKDGPKALEAIKGHAWESPRGPIKIEADTREITQNVYIRRVEEIDGKLGNRPFHTYEAVVEPWHAQKNN